MGETFLSLIYIYLFLGLFFSWQAMVFINPTDEQMEELKSHPEWPLMKETLEETWMYIQSYPPLKYIVAGLIIIFWLPMLIKALLTQE